MMAMPISLMEYSLNEGFIADNLCENRSKSEMHCGGKCYLSKNLAKANDNQDSQNQKSGAKITIVDYCESFGRHSFQLNPTSLQHFGLLLVSRNPKKNVSAILRPPIA